MTIQDYADQLIKEGKSEEEFLDLIDKYNPNENVVEEKVEEQVSTEVKPEDEKKDLSSANIMDAAVEEDQLASNSEDSSLELNGEDPKKVVKLKLPGDEKEVEYDILNTYNPPINEIVIGENGEPVENQQQLYINKNIKSLLHNVSKEEKDQFIENGGDLALQNIIELDKDNVELDEQLSLVSKKYVPGAVYDKATGMYNLDTVKSKQVNGKYYINEYVNKKGEIVKGNPYVINKDDFAVDTSENLFKSAFEGKELIRQFEVVAPKNVLVGQTDITSDQIIDGLDEISTLEKEVVKLEKENADPEKIASLKNNIKRLKSNNQSLVTQWRNSVGLEEVISSLSGDVTPSTLKNLVNSALPVYRARTTNRKDGFEIATKFNDALSGYNIAFQPMDMGSLTSDFTNVSFFINPTMGTDEKSGLVDINKTWYDNIAGREVNDFFKKIGYTGTYLDMAKEAGKVDDDGVIDKDWALQTLKQEKLFGIYDHDGPGTLRQLVDTEDAGFYIPEWWENSEKDLKQQIYNFKDEISDAMITNFGEFEGKSNSYDMSRPAYDPFRLDNISLYRSDDAVSGVSTFTKKVISEVEKASKAYKKVAPKIKNQIDIIDNTSEAIEKNAQDFKIELEDNKKNLNQLKIELKDNAGLFESNYKEYKLKANAVEEDIQVLKKEYQGKIDKEVNPVKQEELIKEFNNKQQEIIDLFRPVEQDYNEKQKEVQQLDEYLVNEYNETASIVKDFVENDELVRYDKDFVKDKNKAVEKLNKLKPDAIAALNQLTFLSDYGKDLKTKVDLKILNIQKVLEESEGQGSALSVVTNRIKETAIKASGGVSLLAGDLSMAIIEGRREFYKSLPGLLPSTFPKIPNLWSEKDEKIFKADVNLIDTNQKQISNEVTGMIDYYSSIGFDDNFAKTFGETTVGGISLFMADLIGRGGPLGGMAMFTQTRLDKYQMYEDEVMQEKASLTQKFIEEGLDPKKAARKANNQVENSFSKSDRRNAALVQSTVMAALEQMTLGILGGGVKITKSVIKPVTNYVLSGLPKTKMSMAMLQRYVNQKLGGKMVGWLAMVKDQTINKGLSELIVEELQTYAEWGIDNVIENTTGIDIDQPEWNSPEFQEMINQTRKVAFGGAMIFGIGGMVMKGKSINTAIKNYDIKQRELNAVLEQHYNLFRNEEYVQLLKTGLKMRLATNQITEEEFNEQLSNIDQEYSIQSELEADMTGIAAAEVSAKIKEINKLKKEKEKEKSDKRRINKKISGLEAEIDVIYDSSTSYKNAGDLDTNVERNVEIGKILSNVTGTSYEVAENLEEYIQKSEDAGAPLIYLDENGKVINKSSTDAFYVKDNSSGKIVINKEKMKQIGSFSAATHEPLHAITALELRNMSKEDKDQLILDFQKELSFEEFNAVKARLNKSYGKSPDQATSEEWFNAFHDAIVKKDIRYDQKLFSGINNWVVDKILAPSGLVNKDANFKNAKGVYNFVKDYSVQISKMQEGSQELGSFEGDVAKVLANIKPGDVGKGKQFSKTEATTYANQYKDGSIQSENITDFVQQYHNLGLKAMKFDMSKGTIEAEEAISFLNKEFPSIMRNYDPGKGLEFSTYLNSVIPKRAVAFYEEQIGDKASTTSLDSDQARQMEADDSSPTDNRSDKEVRKDELTKIKVKDRIKPIYQENVKELSKIIKSVASQLDLSKLDYKNLKGLFPVETAIAIARNKELGESIAKKIKENKDLSKSEMLAIQKFVKANASLSQVMLPEGYTSKFKATGVQNKLLENYYNKRSVRSKTGAGLNVQVKKPSMADSQFLKPLGIEGNNVNEWTQDRLKQSQLLKAMVMQFDQVITNQSVREQLLEEGKTEDALQTIADGKSVVLFSNTAKTENLGKTFRELGGREGAQVTYLNGLSEFIARINMGQSVDTAFQNTYKDFLNKKDSNPLKIRKNIIKEWKKIYNDFNPNQVDFETGTPNPQKLEEYLYTAFDEQTEKDSVQEILGIDKKGLDVNNNDQLMKYYSFYSEYFGELMQRFNGDEKLFVEYVVNRIMPTLTSAAKVMNGKFKWGEIENSFGIKGIGFVETKKGPGKTNRTGLFNNKQEFLDLLIKPFLSEDTEIQYIPREGFILNGEQIIENRAKQSKAASSQALKEYKADGKISNSTLELSEEYAINNQEAIIDILKWAKDKEADSSSDISINDIGMFFLGSTGNMEAVLRSAYALDSIAVDDKDLDAGNYRYEHNPPVRVMQTYMAQFVNGQITEQQLRDKFKDSSASVIPIQMDDVINVRYKDTIPLAYVNRWSRYLNSYSYGKYPFVVKVYNKVDGKWQEETKGKFMPKAYDAARPALLESATEIKDSKVVSYSDTEITIEEVLSKAATLDNALDKANELNKPIKKIRVFDFDDTLARTKSNVLYTMPDGTTGKLTAEEFAQRGQQMKNDGAIWDFSEFNKVMEGRKGPLFEVAQKIQNARGTEDMFVLTARAPESQLAIKEFLDGVGLKIPLKNITGLGNSTGAAKANWVVDKAAEGYNDFYFADDHMANVTAVQDALSVIDIKSKVQQAKIQFSETMSEDFNRLLEESTGIDYYKEYSAAKAKTVGASKGKFKFFIPYSAEDYVGLIYPTLAKGSLGDAQMAWYKKNVLDPYGIAMESLSADRVQLMSDFTQLKKNLNVPKTLRKKNSSGFTNEQSVRVYLFDKMGYEVPGLSSKDLKEMKSIIESDETLLLFAEEILSVTKGDGYSKPGSNWQVGTITTDLVDLLNTEKRSKYLQKWQQNIDAIYSKENLNKLEALYGSKYREALENMLSRMKSGRNRTSQGGRLENQILDYINGSVGAIMFFNTRSAVLQTISAINFINWDFNNPLKAGQAFANQPQYWKDFLELMNSDYLVDRRNGLKLNISESEIADAAATSKNKAKAVLNYLLEKGYIPTKYADSFAIASGGATFFRNKIKDLLSKNPGMSESEAKEIAMKEFRDIAEVSQQSSDPSKISSQQASGLGRIVLAFANTPMQYARIQKRAFQDLVNGRGDYRANISKIVYYGFVQNLIFNALQQAVYAVGFGDDDEDTTEDEKQRYLNTANGMVDSTLRGLGIGGQAVSVLKNFLLNVYERSDRKRPEYVDAVWELLRFSPPIYAKISRLKQAAWNFDSKKRREKMYDMGFDIENPAYEATAKVLTAVTNVPVDRLFTKIQNINGALDEENDWWKRIAMILGWPKWQLEQKKDAKEKTLTIGGSSKVTIGESKKVTIGKNKKKKIG